ncbi:hypothetical protein ACO0LM_10525 [Undibacterium sp. Di26W]|uniref:hypothetical protein n=1 Tax=Undibacterium sp. Di26W TaxID=3413035 RepID=UPI003BF43A0F
MTPISNQILVAALQSLLTAGPVGTNVYRSREEAFQREELPAIVIRPDNEDTNAFANRVDENNFVFKIEIHVRGEVWDDIAAPVALAVNKALTSDPAILTLCSSIRRVGTHWDGANADLTAGVQTVRYHAIYLSDRRDTSQLI